MNASRLLILALVLPLVGCGAGDLSDKDRACLQMLKFYSGDNVGTLAADAELPIPEDHRVVIEGVETGANSDVQDGGERPSAAEIENANRAIVLLLSAPLKNGELVGSYIEEIHLIIGRLKYYYVQYYTKMRGGERIVAADFFFVRPKFGCMEEEDGEGPPSYWRERSVNNDVKGGGCDYWSVKYDPETDTVTGFLVNSGR